MAEIVESVQKEKNKGITMSEKSLKAAETFGQFDGDAAAAEPPEPAAADLAAATEAVADRLRVLGKEYDPVVLMQVATALAYNELVASHGGDAVIAAHTFAADACDHVAADAVAHVAGLSDGETELSVLDDDAAKQILTKLNRWLSRHAALITTLSEAHAAELAATMQNTDAHSVDVVASHAPQVILDRIAEKTHKNKVANGTRDLSAFTCQAALAFKVNGARVFPGRIDQTTMEE